MLDAHGIIEEPHQSTTRHFDVAVHTLYTTQARFVGCALVWQPVRLDKAGFVLLRGDDGRERHLGHYLCSFLGVALCRGIPVGMVVCRTPGSAAAAGKAEGRAILFTARS